ncbi:collagen alpha-1(XII) chain isoform X1 [Nematostella vectensis]|uniref:collagen alpha-1(XII) chain isoform X1 n=1 Tax=Nematostella vectensis TaxID=45351 RepID=UPI0013901684|nr:collagen alpha-1(XII) chain isoform X1 [Nematostella vectensis]
MVVLWLVLLSGLVFTARAERTLTKNGECPFVESFPACPVLQPNECAVDVDCNETDKCCFNGCILTCTPATFISKPNPNMCEASVDLGFLIDSSASIGYQNFKSVRKMVDRIINVFTISPKQTHVAIITISDRPAHVLRFNTLQGADLNSASVRRVVDNLRFTRDKTRIDLALRMAHKEMFSKLGGGRKHAQKILVVFTDGIQTWRPDKMEKLSKASEPLKKMGVKIIPVGVRGEEINVGSLLDMSLDTYSVFNMEFFPELLQALKKMSKVPCSDNREVRDKHEMKLSKTLKKLYRKRKP